MIIKKLTNKSSIEIFPDFYSNDENAITRELITTANEISDTVENCKNFITNENYSYELNGKNFDTLYEALVSEVGEEFKGYYGYYIKYNYRKTKQYANTFQELCEKAYQYYDSFCLSEKEDQLTYEQKKFIKNIIKAKMKQKI